jgi:hypothetical protein
MTYHIFIIKIRTAKVHIFFELHKKNKKKCIFFLQRYVFFLLIGEIAIKKIDTLKYTKKK